MLAPFAAIGIGHKRITMESASLTGSTVLHYHILERLGYGGMGVVYRAEDTKLKRPVALKFLPAEAQPGSLDRAKLLREARAASALTSPHIVNIYEVEEVEDSLTWL